MKKSRKFIKGKCYSLLFTGYANGDTLNDLIGEYDMIKNSHSIKNSPYNKNKNNKKKKQR